jgi:hypothetical protein
MIRESGVSNVVGVLLLLFLVMVTSAVLGLVLSSATYDAVDTAPDVIFTVSEDPYLLYHGGGDILYKNDLVFYAGGYDVSGSISLEDEGESWTEWHTGQAIYTNHIVSELTIVALDSRGNAYLVYNGPTADPIPGGKPVPDVTPKPTVTPTPSPVTPDASFTLTSVDVGQEVSLGILPSSLANTTNHFVVMKATEHWFLLWSYYTYEADVKFTANENNLQYAWSVSSGADIDDDTSRSPIMTFEESGLYTVTLNVTDTTSGLSNRSTQNISVRKPGITVMTWIKYNGSGTKWDSPYFDAYNRSVVGSTNYKWHLNVEPTNNNYDKYNLKFNIGYDDDSVTDYKESLNIDVWYHLSGTFEKTALSFSLYPNSLNLYFNGQKKDSDTTSDSPADYTGGTTPIDPHHFIYAAKPLFYEIPFAMTEDEIDAVYNAEKLVIQT